MYRSTRAMICGRAVSSCDHVASYKSAQRTQRMLLSFGTGSQIARAPLA